MLVIQVMLASQSVSTIAEIQHQTYAGLYFGTCTAEKRSKFFRLFIKILYLNFDMYFFFLTIHLSVFTIAANMVVSMCLSKFCFMYFHVYCMYYELGFFISFFSTSWAFET